MVSIIPRVDLLGNTVVDWICKLSFFRLDTLLLASGNKLHLFVYFSQDVRGNCTGERSFGVEDAISCSTVAIKRHLSHSRLLVVSTIHAAVLDRSWPAGHAVGHAPRGLVRKRVYVSAYT